MKAMVVMYGCVSPEGGQTLPSAIKFPHPPPSNRRSPAPPPPSGPTCPHQTSSFPNLPSRHMLPGLVRSHSPAIPPSSFQALCADTGNPQMKGDSKLWLMGGGGWCDCFVLTSEIICESSVRSPRLYAEHESKRNCHLRTLIKYRPCSEL